MYPMKTNVARSRYDGRPCYQLDYTAFESLLGSINMVDELRRVNREFYLGIGTWGFTRAARMRPLPFCLNGPVREFVGVDKPHARRRAKFTASGR